MANYNENIRGFLFRSDEEQKSYFYVLFIDIPESWNISPTFDKNPPKFDTSGTVPELTFVADTGAFGAEPTNGAGIKFSTLNLPVFKTSGNFKKINVIVQGTNGKKKTGTVTNSTPIDIPFL